MADGAKLQVIADEKGSRVDRLLLKHFPQLNFVAVQKLLRTGQVRLDGKRVKPGDRVEEGQEIRLPPFLQKAVMDGGVEEKPAAIPKIVQEKFKSQIIYEDDHIVVLNKWSGLAVQGGSKTHIHVDGIGAALYPRKLKLVHRLDKDTSGILLLAKTGQAAGVMTRAFADKETEKVYWAITEGVPKVKSGIINLPLAKKLTKGTERIEIDHEDGDEAVTEYRTIETHASGYALLELKPITGRTHQLRVHCASMQAPILGDHKYGFSGKVLEGWPSPLPLHLHARRITFPHPELGMITMRAPMPDYFEQAFQFFNFKPIRED